MFHCACRQSGIDITNRIERSYKDITNRIERSYKKGTISFHYFNTLNELLILSQRFHLDLQRFHLDLAVIAAKGDFLKELELVRLMKSHIFLSIIPTVLYHPDPPDDILIAGFQNGVDEFLHGEWRDKLFEVQMKMIAERSSRDISFNPSMLRRY